MLDVGPEWRVGNIGRIATILDSELNDLDRAVAYYQDILATAPEHENARTSLMEALRRLERWADLVQGLYDAAPYQSEGERLESRFEIATIYREHLDNLDAALDALESVLVEDNES